MKLLKSIKLLYKNSPAARIITFVAVVGIIAMVTSVSGRKHIGKPSISTIDPPIGSTGDIVVITGENFGSTRENSFVEIAGSRVTASNYRDWDNEQIEFVVPPNVDDGLVVVQTAEGRSEPTFFARKDSIPVAVRTDYRVSVPVIDSVSPSTAKIGDVISILGSNFGNARGNSTVYFTANRDDSVSNVPDINKLNAGFIAASDADYDFEYWTDSEIRVHIPDGATSGQLYIATDKGNSYKHGIDISFPAGQKKFVNGKTYVLQINADIQNRSQSDTNITLYVPRPTVCVSQPAVVLNEVFPNPLIQDDPYDVIHSIQLKGGDNSRIKLNHNFIITSFSEESNIIGSNVTRYTDAARLLNAVYTSADECVPSDNKAVRELADSIVGKIQNPYSQVNLVYNYMLDNFTILNTVRTGDVSPVDLIEKKSGDAYDFAILFTALCRSLGIPSVPVSGILVEADSTTKNHWWSEVYFEHYGWFPVDIALAAGLSYKTFGEIENPRQHYFGNLDGQHIAFSRRWNRLKTSLANGKTVFRPRSYALQSIWEEVNSTEADYSSLWNDPVIVGIYGATSF